MLLGERAYRRNLIVRALYCPHPFLSKQLRFNPNRKKLRIKTACFCADCVEMTVAELLLDIDVFVEQSLRGIDVHIDCDRALMNGSWIRGSFCY
jgi:hypothetical protein